MTCKNCKNYQKTQSIEYNINDKGMKNPKPLYDCPFANEWCEYDSPINVLCNNKFEPKEERPE